MSQRPSVSQQYLGPPEVFRRAKRIYEKFDHPHEWTLDYQGAQIGYSPREMVLRPDLTTPARPRHGRLLEPLGQLGPLRGHRGRRRPRLRGRHRGPELAQDRGPGQGLHVAEAGDPGAVDRLGRSREEQRLHVVLPRRIHPQQRLRPVDRLGVAVEIEDVGLTVALPGNPRVQDGRAEPDVVVVLPGVAALGAGEDAGGVALVVGDEVREADLLLEPRQRPPAVAPGLVGEQRVQQVARPVGDAVDRARRIGGRAWGWRCRSGSGRSARRPPGRPPWRSPRWRRPG